MDTTVQPKAVAFPTDVGLMRKAIISLVDLAKKNNINLRQTYERVVKRAAIKSGRYRHAKQMKRAKREEQFIRIRLGRVVRDINRKIQGNDALRYFYRRPVKRRLRCKNNCAIANKKCIHGMRLKQSALEKAKHISLMNLVAKYR